MEDLKSLLRRVIHNMEKIKELIDRAMTSGSVIGVEHYKNHSIAWKTERDYFAKEIEALIIRVTDAIIGEDEKSFVTYKDHPEWDYETGGSPEQKARNEFRKSMRIKRDELLRCS